MRTIINLVENVEAKSPVEQFWDAYYGATQPNPFNDRCRVLGGAMIELSRSMEGENYVHISDIRSMQRGSGAGSAALKSLCNLADKFNIGLDLDAKAYEAGAPLNTKQLRDWYLRNGFKVDYGSASEGYTMVRAPHGAIASETPEPPPEPASKDENGNTIIKLRGFKRKH